MDNFWISLGVLGALGETLGAFWELLGSPWRALGLLLGVLGSSWGRLGGVLGPCVYPSWLSLLAIGFIWDGVGVMWVCFLDVFGVLLHLLRRQIF